MGLRNGAHALIERLQYGLYNRVGARTYTIYVDGELMRYKGMVDTNLACHNACEEIARTSFAFMRNMVESVEELMSPFRPTEIVVYMDGEQRIKNKVIRAANRLQYDVKMVRSFFVQMCRSAPRTRVECLDCGESELQMYLRRARTNDLNIFVTSDSDMIAIAYGHRPVACLEASATIDDSATNWRVINANRVYAQPSPAMLDSCLWINCSYKTVAIGCDFSDERLRLRRRHFLIFVGMCGTDFTANMIAETCIRAVLDADEDDIELINSRETMYDIVAAILFVGIKNGGTLKPIKACASHVSRNIDDYLDNLSVYSAYIESGVMVERDLKSVDVSTVSRQIFTDLGYPGTVFRKSQLAQWCKQCDINEIFPSKNKSVPL